MDAHDYPYPVLSSTWKSHHLVRRADDSSPTIIIAAVAVIGGLLALFILWRVVLHRRQHGFANPLPPVQPLAHIREQQLTELKIDNFRSLHAGTGSNTSLLQTGSSACNMDTSPDVSVSSSLNHEPLVVSDNLPLPIPQPPYFPPPASGHGPGHRRDNSVSSISPSNDHGPLSAPAASMSNSSSNRSLPRSRSRSRIGAASHSTYSVVSSISDVSGQASRARHSGLPHTYENFQIVLPKPLAPELYPYDSVSDTVGPGAPKNPGMRRSMLLPESNPTSSSRVLSDRWLSVRKLDDMASMNTISGESQSSRNGRHTRSRSGESEILF